MNRKQLYIPKILLFVILFGALFIVSASCQDRQDREDKIIHILSEGSSIAVKISYPGNLITRDKIIIWSRPPLTDAFMPDSISRPQEKYMAPFLRNKLLENGYINIEYIGCMDSLEFMGRKYVKADSETKSVDLMSLLRYIQADKTLSGKSIILVGCSEGGSVNTQIASERNSDIYAMVQLACSALSGKELVDYQKETIVYRELLLVCGSEQEYMDKSLNKLSSLDSYHKADWDGMRQLYKENYQPIGDIINDFENIDSIYFHAELYLRSRWSQEDEETRKLYSDSFEKYYRMFAEAIVNPQQIALRKYMPEKYYPDVKCPLLAVHGTRDERIDCYPNIENMERLLSEGGNHNFHKMILEGYDHSLIKSDGPVSTFTVEDAVLSEIVDWIEKQ